MGERRDALVKQPASKNDILEEIDVGSRARGSLWSFLVIFYAGLVVLVCWLVLSALYEETEDDLAYTEAGAFGPEFADADAHALDDIVAVLTDGDDSEVKVALDEIGNIIPEVRPDTDISIERPAIDVGDTLERGWQQNRGNWIADSGEARLAIVIDDVGIVKSASRRLSSMLGPYTLAFLPYATRLESQARRARAAGHELIIHMPMEPKTRNADPGRNALLSSLDHAEFATRLDWNLSRFEGFVGINNHMGSLLTEDAGAMVHIMAELKQRDLLFLDSLTSPKSQGIRAAKAVGVPNIARDIFLDNVRDQDLILEQLRKAETIARLRGYAVAIGHPYPETLDVLAAWRQTLDDRGIKLVPLSQLVSERSRRDYATNKKLIENREGD